MPSAPNTLAVLQSQFRLPSFRPGQEAVINALLQGRSALAVFPTGGGKSLCYQLPALMLEGVTLVVSPLIALMKDQVDALQALGIAAARLDSSLSKEETFAIYDGIQANTIKLLYVSPERLKNERFVQRLARMQISLLAIDEAHCISEWGHNFRPDYLKLADLARTLQVARVLALTATATPSVAADICTQFAILPQDHIQTSFARPNLQLRVTPCAANARITQLLARLHKHPPGAATIVYVTLQKTAEDVAAAINAANLAQMGGIGAPATAPIAAHYHAGLKDEERNQIQNNFMDGSTPIVVATIAFGMGIDKSNIRAVYHFNLPKSIENYVQEIGRAGRDGLPSLCEMFATPDDIRVLENFTYGDTPSAASLRELVEYVQAQSEQFDLSSYELSNRFDLRPLVLNTALTYLELNASISAQSPFYTEYKLRFIENKEAILAAFNSARADFLRRLFEAGKMGSKWLTLDMLTISEALQEPKERITKALDYLAETGAIELTVANLRQTYRNNLSHADAAQVDALCAMLSTLFAQREARDIERIHSILAYANNPQCLSQQLIEYFGEAAPTACGLCSHCRAQQRGQAIGVVEAAIPRAISQSECALIAALRQENHHGLRQPRQMARFLCGLPSPATSRSTLKKHTLFGALDHLGFQALLALLDEGEDVQTDNEAM